MVSSKVQHCPNTFNTSPKQYNPKGRLHSIYYIREREKDIEEEEEEEEEKKAHLACIFKSAHFQRESIKMVKNSIYAE